MFYKKKYYTDELGVKRMEAKLHPIVLDTEGVVMEGYNDEVNFLIPDRRTGYTEVTLNQVLKYLDLKEAIRAN